MLYTEAIELLKNKSSKGEETIKFTEDESLELSNLYKKSYSIINEMEHYFRISTMDSELSEEQREFIKEHNFSFECYVQADNIYLLVDSVLNSSLLSQSKDFIEEFLKIIDKKYKKEEGN